MKRLRGKLLVPAVLVLAGAVAVLVWKRDDARRYASERTLEFIQKTVEEQLPESTRNDAREEFLKLRDALSAGTLPPDRMVPLLETFSEVYADRRLDASDVGRIREKVRDLVGTLGDS